MSTYDLQKIKDLVEFDDDCCCAANYCPQVSMTRVIEYSNSLSIAECYLRFFNLKTLWEYGYYKYLTTKALNTFDRYTVFRSGDIYDTIRKIRYRKDDRFVIKTSYTK